MERADCIFCKIARGELPCELLYQDNQVIAFEDARPQAPVHFLVIPRKHISSLDTAEADEESLLGHIMLIAAKVARDKGIAVTGYRQVVNCGANGGQFIFHLHLHILGGRRMRHMG